MSLNDDRIITLNCGLGRDSISMLLLCLEGRLECDRLGAVQPDDLDVVVFSNTGCEWPHTYRLIPRVKRLCEKAGIWFLVLDKGDEWPDERDPDNYQEIEGKAAGGGYHLRPEIMDDFHSRETVASLGKGDCTDNHKIQPIRRLLNDLSRVRFDLNNRKYSYRVRERGFRPHISLVGIAADEASRIPDEDIGPYYVDEEYPLKDMALDKADEAPVLERHGFDDVRKSGCFMCPYQPAGWYWALSVEEPEKYRRVVQYEADALARNPNMAATGFKKNGEPMTIPEVVERWRSNNPDAEPGPVLEKSYSRCTGEVRKKQKSQFDAEHPQQQLFEETG